MSLISIQKTDSYAPAGMKAAVAAHFAALEVEKDLFPGMKVLAFAFDHNGQSAYLPHNHVENCVIYTGTHDNDTLAGWLKTMPKADRRFAWEYIKGETGEGPLDTWDIIRLAVSSTADLAIVPLQDYLCIGKEGRINTPSTLGGNWIWRLKKGEFTAKIRKRCRKLNAVYGRCEDLPLKKRTD